jgi:hypothetical protein
MNFWCLAYRMSWTELPMSGKFIESSASLDMTSFRSSTSAVKQLSAQARDFARAARCAGFAEGLRRSVAVVLAVQTCWLAQLCKNPFFPSGQTRRVAVALIADETTSTPLAASGRVISAGGKEYRTWRMDPRMLANSTIESPQRSNMRS